MKRPLPKRIGAIPTAMRIIRNPVPITRAINAARTRNQIVPRFLAATLNSRSTIGRKVMRETLQVGVLNATTGMDQIFLILLLSAFSGVKPETKRMRKNKRKINSLAPQCLAK
jgi:hypothetical protein